jgi:hypothetical protein
LIKAFIATKSAFADQALLKTHCAKCHGDTKPKGDFSLRSLGDSPGREYRPLGGSIGVCEILGHAAVVDSPLFREE